LTINLLDYLEQAAARHPDKTAFTEMEESLSFAALHDKARGIGAAIAARVEGTNRPVVVLTKHLLADVPVMLGVLYAGCFYVPIDGEAPAEFIETRIASISPALVIDPACFDVTENKAAENSKISLPYKQVLDTDPAYAIFTSGTTGTPKAALMSHRSVMNLAEWLCDTFSLDENTVFGNQSPFYFDASVVDMYCTLKAAACTHILPRRLFFSPLKLMRYLEERAVNTLMWATAAIKLVANTKVLDKFVPAHLKTILFGGENMTGKYLNAWRKALPNALFANLYGPTEATVMCSYYIVDRDFADDESVPIGRPCRNTGLLLTDDGEVAVQGISVGLGYYGDTARTADVFVQNPTHSLYRDIVYLTGDLARANENGDLVYIGRADSQVKHQGTRIELGEIEAIACGLPGVALACCAYDKERSRIMLFFQGESETEHVAEKLGGMLPRYMFPEMILRVAEMPALPNGKIDRKGLVNAYHEANPQP